MASGTTRVRIESTTVGTRQVVYLHVAGYRFELDAPSRDKARAIVMEIARSLGMVEPEETVFHG